MTAELRNHPAVELALEEMTALAGPDGVIRVNEAAVLDLAQGYSIRALDLDEGVPAPDEVVNQVRHALLTRAPLLVDNQ